MKPKARTLGELKISGYRPLSVKEELRRNVIEKLRHREPLFPGIIGFDDTVIPQLVNALLAKHDMILLGLRGQAKTRIARMLINFLDEYIPIVAGSEVNDNPFSPISKYATELLAEMGEETPIEWIHRSERYGEKLATPDVTIADLIGDIDPIKAATQRLQYSHEGAIHFGIIPRTNRGIFVINELPDLQPRIQVGLFNILQERDIQIRGFKVRLPLDICIVFTANPEDYTRRGTIITPLKDRIQSQILTHYPRTLEDAIAITEQEAWLHRAPDMDVVVPLYLKQIVENIAFIARTSEFIDQSSGVSTRLSIATMEALVSNAERRSIATGEQVIVPRIVDFHRALTGIIGKVELVFEGEQEGPIKVAKALVGRSVRETFKLYFPDPLARPRRRESSTSPEPSIYTEIIRWFEAGNTITIDDTMPTQAFVQELDRVPTLRHLVVNYLKVEERNPYELGTAMEFVLEALHQNSRLAKEELDSATTYKDMLGTLFSKR
ncbi:MAG: sigma 54-interacting transcriptional regulator, partial [Candidatus Kapabacteria bacterium]|nr:sigma 54-interacting transcriptional regulator [Candidatus Kapabacteria bacterium]